MAKRGRKKVIKQRLGQARRSKGMSGTQAAAASGVSSENRRDETAALSTDGKTRNPNSRRRGSQQDGNVADKAGVKSRLLTVEAYRIEQLPLSENGPDSNLIARSLARMRRKP